MDSKTERQFSANQYTVLVRIRQNVVGCASTTAVLKRTWHELSHEAGYEDAESVQRLSRNIVKNLTIVKNLIGTFF